MIDEPSQIAVSAPVDCDHYVPYQRHSCTLNQGSHMILANVVLAFFTGGSITGPMEFEGLGTVWRYEGKANFAHQHEEAMDMLKQHCQARRGRPVIVSIGDGRQGVVRFGNNYVGNKSQVIFFRCK